MLARAVPRPRALPLSARRPVRARPGVGLRGRQFHLGALAQAIRAVDHDLVPDGQPLGDDGPRRVGRASDDLADRYGAVVLDDIDEAAHRAELDRGVGNDDGAGHGVDEQANVDELARKECVVRIGESRAQLERAGRRVDLIVERRQRPRRQFVDIGSIEDGYRQSGARIEATRDTRQIVFRGREHDADRVELGNHDEARRIRSLHVVPGVDEPQADAAGNRRNDVGIIDVELGRVDHRLVGRHRRLVLRDEEGLVVDLLMRDRVLLAQGDIAREVGLRLPVEGRVLGELTLRLREHRLERARIDLGEKIAFLDELAFREADLHQLARDLGLDRNGRQRGDRAERVDGDRHVARNGVGGAHGLRRRAFRFGGTRRIQGRGPDLLVIEPARDQGERERQDDDQPRQPIASRRRGRRRRGGHGRGRGGMDGQRRGPCVGDCVQIDLFVHSTVPR